LGFFVDVDVHVVVDAIGLYCLKMTLPDG
jgi:hypothetical protein